MRALFSWFLSFFNFPSKIWYQYASEWIVLMRMKVTYRSKGVKCESCRNWYHLKCGKISDDVYASITEIVWYCESCCRAKNKEKDTPQVKLFLRNVDDIVRTVRGEPSCLLDAANSLHPNLQFTLEKTNSEGNLPFQDLTINVSQGRRVTCSWYQIQQIQGLY